MKKELLIFSGNPKAGSTWLGGLLTGISIEMGLNIFYGQYSLAENFHTIKNGSFDIVISQSSNYAKMIDLDIPYRGIHVIRDPRDVCVSSYFSYKKTHDIGEWKEMEVLRDVLNRVPFEEGMIEVFKFNQFFFNTLEKWNYQDDNILEMKYEDIIYFSREKIIKILKFLGLFDQLKSSTQFRIKGFYNRLLHKKRGLYSKFRYVQNEIPLNRIIDINRSLAFNKLTAGRKRGSENASSHYRKGIIGDWKNYFTEEHKTDFKKRYNNLLLKLGYEEQSNW